MLTRYQGHGPSIFSLYKRSNSTSCFSKIAYHTNKRKQLRPLTNSNSDSMKNDSEDPIADVGIPACTIMSVAQIHYKQHQDIVLTDLPSLSREFSQDLLVKKLELCCTLCDYSDPDVDLNAKRIKASNLQDIDNYFSDEKNIKSLPNETIDALFKMINTNLFRGIPMTDPKYLIFDDEPPIIEVNWPHLQHVYSILMKFQKAQPKDQRINADYLKKIYTLLEAPDLSERNNVMEFLKKYIETYPDQLPKILRHFEATVRDYIDRVIPPFPIAPIISIYLSILKDPKHDKDLTDHFFKTAIIPLISAQHIVSFYGYLTEIFDIFIQEDTNYAISIIKRLINAWPESAPSKQQLFISLINLVTGKIPPEEFEKVGPLIFGLYSNVAASSSHAKIVQASLKIWSDVKIIPMIMDNTQAILPIIFPPVQAVMKGHWSTQARNAALDAMTSMHDYDPFMFDELTQQQTSDALSAKASAQIPKHRNWALIARIAARRDNSLNLARILADIQMKFSENQNTPDQKKHKKRSSSAKQAPKIVSPPSAANFMLRP